MKCEKISRYDKQHRDPETEKSVSQKIFGKTGYAYGFTRHCPGLKVTDIKVVSMHKDQQEHGNKRPEPELAADKG
jgi:hypothetical protein